MPRLINLRREIPPRENYVRIDRRTKWGNPFIIGIHGTREEVIEQHRLWVMAALDELKGKDLGCWCHPLTCHGENYFVLNGEKLTCADSSDW